MEILVTTIDAFKNTQFTTGFWSWDVSYDPGDGSPGSASVIVNSLPSSRASLTGSLANVGDVATATFINAGGAQPQLQLSAFCDVSGASILTDGSSFYAFGSSDFTAGARYKVVQGFGHFAEPLAADQACFTAGTELQGPFGATLVEELRPGNLLKTVDGTMKPVVWVGSQQVPAGYHGDRPVVISKGAFGDGQPYAPLMLSPNHAILCGDYLVPVKYLVNEISVTWPPLERPTRYYHVELPCHDTVIAHGLAVETFLNTSGRDGFDRQILAGNWRTGGLSIWGSDSFRPLATSGPIVKRIRSLLNARASATGGAQTRDADLTVSIDGVLQAATWDGAVWNGTLSPGSSILRLSSRASVSRDLTGGGDGRLLGVAVSHIEHRGARVDLAAATLGSGWHEPEGAWRWTNGNASLHHPCLVYGGHLTIQTLPMLAYPVRPNATHLLRESRAKQEHALCALC